MITRFKYMFEMKDVCFSYRDKEVLHGLNFSVEKGEIFGFLGPSGAGKTTTIKLLTRQLRKDSGTINVFGKSIENAHNSDYDHIGILTDNSALYERMSIEDNLKFYARIRGVSDSTFPLLLERMDLYQDRKTLVKNCSRGMRQRAALLAAIVHNPPLLFLDEPSNGLDPVTRREVHELLLRLRKLGTTVFLTTHDMTEAERLCNRVGILHEGALVACDAPELLTLGNAKNVVRIRTNDHRMIDTTKDRMGLPAIIKVFEANDCLAIHSEEPNLEEVFLQLTGKEF